MFGLYNISVIKAKTFGDGRFTFFGNFSHFKLKTESKDAIGQIKIGPYNPIEKKIFRLHSSTKKKVFSEE